MTRLYQAKAPASSLSTESATITAESFASSHAFHCRLRLAEILPRESLASMLLCSRMATKIAAQPGNFLLHAQVSVIHVVGKPGGQWEM